jgi:kynurenine 3-monooxygenase
MGDKRQKTIIIGAGPVGALAALYAAQRGYEVEIYELRSGTFCIFSSLYRDSRESFEIHLLS